MKAWGWCLVRSDNVHGPFDSRESAIEDAKQNFDYYFDKEKPTWGPPSKPVYIGGYEQHDPLKYISVDVQDVLNGMNNQLRFYLNRSAVLGEPEAIFGQPQLIEEDEINAFSARDLEKAEKELKEYLRHWARKWVVSDACLFTEVEVIYLEPEAPTEQAALQAALQAAEEAPKEPEAKAAE